MRSPDGKRIGPADNGADLENSTATTSSQSLSPTTDDVVNLANVVLSGKQMVETKALDPVVLRGLVVDAIDDVLDDDTLTDIIDEYSIQADDLKRRLSVVSAKISGTA